jgi:hypothetical protein
MTSRVRIHSRPERLRARQGIERGHQFLRSGEIKGIYYPEVEQLHRRLSVRGHGAPIAALVWHREGQSEGRADRAARFGIEKDAHA